jgi:hypothetical protein
MTLFNAKHGITGKTATTGLLHVPGHRSDAHDEFENLWEMGMCGDLLLILACLRVPGHRLPSSTRATRRPPSAA